MECKDAQAITDAEIEQGWDANIEKYQKRLEDQQSGKAISLVAEYSGNPVGYINIYPNSAWGAFGGKGYPEIVDFGVLEKYRNRGIGTVLMDIAEKIAAIYADIVYLGVGLHSGYEISSLLQNLDIRFPGNCHKFLAASHTTARQGPGPCFYLPSSLRPLPGPAFSWGP